MKKFLDVTCDTWDFSNFFRLLTKRLLLESSHTIYSAQLKYMYRILHRSVVIILAILNSTL